MKRPNIYTKPLSGERKESYHPADYHNNQYAEDLNKYIDYLEVEVKKLNKHNVSGRSEQFVCLCPRNETDNCDRKEPCKECETCPHLRQTNCH